MSYGESPHNSHLLFVGQQCHAAQCYMVDFLPFRCDHCTNAFCADHYKPNAHSCEKYDEAKHDRVAPSCPLCNTPVAIPPQQDPNLRMEQHIEKECSVTTGRKTKAGSMPVCARGNCRKVLFAPIKCNSCNQQFCAAHRFPSSHTCSTSKPASSSSKPAASSSKRVASTSTSSAGTSIVNQTSAASAAAMAAIKRNMATASPSKPAAAKPDPPKAESGGSSSKATNPFSKTDRRAKAEQESRRRAMKERAKKGLLSEREQVLLAEEEAALAKRSGKKDSDCIVM